MKKDRKRNRDKYFKSLWILPCLIIMPVLALGQTQNLSDLMQAAHSAGIEQSRLSDLQNRATTRGITDQQLAQIIEPVIALAEQNLPIDLVYQKTLEGIAKGVSPERLHPVLYNLQINTEATVPLIDNWMGKNEVRQMMNRPGAPNHQYFRNNLLNAGAKAMAQDLTPEALQYLLDAIGEEATLNRSNPEGILVAVNIFPDLPSTVQYPQASSSVIAKALQNGFNASDLQKLPSAMNSAQRRSQMPAAAVMEGLLGQLTMETPASHVLQNLFNGNIGGGPPGTIPPGLNNRQGRGRPGN